MLTETRPTFGQHVKALRRALGLSQKEVAYCAGCSLKTIEKIEAGERRPSRQVAELLATCLAVPSGKRQSFLELSREPLTAVGEASTTAPPTSSVQPFRSTIPNNLPAPATPFIGREAEVQVGTKLLRSDEVRLLTFSGPPGIGKTRLSLRVATAMLGMPDFAEGIYFVPLATIREPSAVAAHIARTLKVADDDTRTPVELLREYMRGKRILLLLDNFEQVVSAGPVVSELLLAAPGLKVVTSSREPLHLYGEHDFPVPPLSLPDPSDLPSFEKLEHYEGIRLFLQRASAVQPGFAISPDNASDIVAICARLDGLPLAIELAAARTRHFTPGEILQRLEPSLQLLVGGPQDLPPRQQTLRAAIEWSYDLLSPDEQFLFRALGLFAGADPNALRGVWSWHTTHANESEAVAPEDVAASLVDKNMLRLDPTEDGGARYWMLETIRDYALEKLNADPQGDEIAGQHTAYYLALAEEANVGIRGPQGGEWLARLEVEHDNLRLALRRSLIRGDSKSTLRLGSALRWFWYLRGYVVEGRRWLDEALSVGTELSRERAEALTALGVLAERVGDHEGATAALTESLAAMRSLGDNVGVASALHNLAGVALEHSDYERAEAIYNESLAIWRSLDDKRSIGSTIHNMSLIAYSRGDYERALQMCREAIPLLEEAGDLTFVSRVLIAVGEILRLQGNYPEAAQYYRRSMDIADRLGDRKGKSLVLCNLGYVERRIGEIDRAEAYTLEALKFDVEAGDRANIAQDIIAVAGIAGARGEAEKAARLFAAAGVVLHEVGITLAPPDIIEYERDLSAAQAQLSDVRWAELTHEGEAMSLEEAVAYASGGEC
jgi:predicted ATPase/transcriptional regulator with XRE-family HTH domain